MSHGDDKPRSRVRKFISSFPVVPHHKKRIMIFNIFQYFWPEPWQGRSCYGSSCRYHCSNPSSRQCVGTWPVTLRRRSQRVTPLGLDWARARGAHVFLAMAMCSYDGTHGIQNDGDAGWAEASGGPATRVGRFATSLSRAARLLQSAGEREPSIETWTRAEWRHGIVDLRQPIQQSLGETYGSIMVNPKISALEC